MDHTQTRRRHLGVMGSLLLLASGVARASFPAKPITIVVGFPPGGSTDTLARILATKLTERLGQPVNVDNRVGATGTIAAASVARSPADGHTLLFAAAGHTISAAFLPLKYNPVKDFEPITMVATLPNLVVVHPSVAVNSLSELIAYGKSNPNQLNFASTGNTSINRMAVELFQWKAGVKMSHVAYKGSGQAITDLLAGRVQVAFDQVTSVIEHVRAGKLKALAVTSSRRLAELPDLPTVAEAAGLNGYSVVSWNGLLAPAGLQRDVVATLVREVRAAVQAPDTRAAIARAGADADGGAPEELGEFLRTDLQKWTEVVKVAGIRAD